MEWRNTPLEGLANILKKLAQCTHYKYGKTIHATQAFSILLLLQIEKKISKEQNKARGN